MLQQTTVATVKPRFRRFLDRWPTVQDLAAADDYDVLNEWAGLGYYARARNLIACARQVRDLGAFPTSAAALQRLPGLGPYTAAAIAAIAFDEPVAAVDTNVERVICRLAAIDRPIADVRPQIRDLAQSIVTRDRPGDVAQAMMDLGSTICRAAIPVCEACPLASDCLAYQSGRPGNYPASKARKARPLRHGTAWWFERNGAIWLVRRPAKGMLGGMAALPGDDWHRADPVGNAAASVAHHFTHFTLNLAVVEIPSLPTGDGWWHPLEQIGTAGLPTLYVRAVEAVLAQKESHD